MNIIEMAREAGFTIEGTHPHHPRRIHGYDRDGEYTQELEDFAALVEAAARADEREECAELCDGLADTHEKLSQWSSHKTADTLAQAIRARGNT